LSRCGQRSTQRREQNTTKKESCRQGASHAVADELPIREG
jgi:hypothetical protein